jgi:glycine dehydrogenase subunit 1
MDVVNSSHYDGSTALAEALLMALRVKKGRNIIVVPETLNPEYIKTLRAYLEPHNIEIRYAKVNVNGELDLSEVEEVITQDVAAVVGELPNGLGKVDPGLLEFGELAHRRGALYIVVADPIASTIYKPPGELGADIAVGEGQPLGLGLNYGGPYLGIMAVRWDLKLIRQMPGRIVGLTRDTQGNRAFSLILQTREQHIRRARATSNITTNEALMALLAAAYIAGHGFKGLKRVAENIRAKTLYARELLRRSGLYVLGGEIFREISVKAPCRFSHLQDELRSRKGLYIGPPLLDYLVPWTNDSWGIIAVTEAHRESHIRYLADSIREIIIEGCGK